MLTLERLKKDLHYDPQTGVFTWLVHKGSRVPGPIPRNPDKNGYLRVGVDGKTYKQHRLAWYYMTSEWPPEQIDHIDTIVTNNRWANLRLATQTQNQCNRGARKKTVSGLKGVSWNAKKCRWQVSVGLNNKLLYVGLFDDKYEAHAAYCRAAQECHGVFVNTGRC